MSIESELLEVLERSHRPNKETQRNYEMLADLFGFGKDPAPTVEQTGRKFGVTKQWVSEVLNRDLIDVKGPYDIPSLDQFYHTINSKDYWSYSELSQALVESGVVGEQFHIEGIFNLREYLRLPNEYDFYSPGLKPQPRQKVATGSRPNVVAHRVIDRAKRLLKEARRLAGECGIAKLDYLLDQNAELEAVHPLIQELIKHSGLCWTHEENGTVWYAFEKVGRGNQMPQNRLRTYSEKVFVEQDSCAVEKLAISYCNALADRSMEPFHVPIHVMENYLRNSSNFQVVGERIEFRGSVK